LRGLPLLLPWALLASPAASQEFRAPNGLRVLLDERHDHPLVRLELRVAWEGPESSGPLVAVLERSGAGGFGRAALERALADRGLSLKLGGGRHSLGWSMLADSQAQEDAFEFLAHGVFRPSLAEGLAALRRHPKPSPEEAFRAALGLSVEDAGAPRLDLPGLLALHRRMVRPERALLIIQGDLNLAQARQLVMLHFGTWAPAQDPSVQGSGEPPSIPARQTFPGAPRAAWAGSPAPEGGAPARAAHGLLALLLERAFAGDPAIALEAPRPEGDAGAILFRTLPSAGPDPERVLRERLEPLGVQGFQAADLEGAKRRWRAERLTLALHPAEDLAARAERLLCGDPGANLEEVRLQDVNAALRARLSSLHWLLRGD